MANFNFYLLSCALLLVCSSRSSGHPVRALSAESQAQCAVFRSLLLDVAALIGAEDLCRTVSADKVTPSGNNETVLSCAPTQTSGCMLQRNSSFSESECLGNIGKDLAHYQSVIQSYLDLDHEKQIALLSPILEKITSLRKSFSLKPSEETDSSSSPERNPAPRWEESAYSNRYNMCKMMRGFHIRMITINRAMGYISSGDHRK
ncbi:interleukin-12 subunit alpha [Salarias fasciatus]|uniref:interleukin-12 subunit alpha n=1 Tax=Salarias fasciatus TaxID=181472 RepID=UPI0011769F31|nr:interleukin-12 subunit alpha-like [Salarias fasciatus]